MEKLWLPIKRDRCRQLSHLSDHWPFLVSAFWTFKHVCLDKYCAFEIWHTVRSSTNQWVKCVTAIFCHENNKNTDSMVTRTRNINNKYQSQCTKRGYLPVAVHEAWVPTSRSARNVGTPVRLINWCPLKSTLFKLFRPRTGLAYFLQACTQILDNFQDHSYIVGIFTTMNTTARTTTVQCQDWLYQRLKN